MLSNKEITKLNIFADEIRLKSILSMGSFGSGHVGGVLSSADLISVLYGNIMHYDPANPNMEDRDRIILSKGHCGPVLYAALALKGFFNEELLKTLNQNNTMLPSHCNMLDTPGIDVSTGSLGQGASLAAGIALGMKLNNINRYAYLVLGDGECDEGQVWEMALFANSYKLNNLIAFIDCNHQQLDGYTDDICPLGNLEKKFEDFGWNTEKVNGHNVEEIYDAICRAKEETNRPSMIVLDTVKGKGWSGTEGKTNIHHIKISQQQMKEAEKEICARIEKQKLSIKE